MSRRIRIVVRWRVRRSRLGRFMTGSIAAHGLALVAVLVVPLVHRTPPPMDNAMVVELAGPAVAPARRPAAPQAPAPAAAPAPAPAPKEAHVVHEVPAPKPKEKPKEDKTPPKPAQTPPSPVPAPAAGPPGSAGKGPPSSPQPAAATGVTASLGSGEAALGWYGAAVKSALESAWVKPYLENQGGTYSVTISFDIARDGTVRNVRIVQGSGVQSLDRSAERAVLQASPLPPVPPAWTEPFLPATMRFDLTPGAP